MQLENSTPRRNCLNGQYFDTINKVCYTIPAQCPVGSQTDFQLGCRCTQGQTYNGARGQCEFNNNNQQRTCPNGQYFDTVNNVCYDNPTVCPSGAQMDAILGCRCAQNQDYNGATGLCQDKVIPDCTNGQFYDKINKRCNPLPLSSQCPAGAPYDSDLGCLCPVGQAFNGVSRQCQLPQCPINSVKSGSVCRCNRATDAFDVQRNTCVIRYQCPTGSVSDPILGCICNNSQLIYDNMANTCAEPVSN
ncbi:multiple epidermal growth factor-like domains protein 6 [Elysia marginata]|uniref:Multiple epidermal growth factor-like domains protein 6 n=1 Tax=Elysia marginata TaxID=1093978 RepID=A0AAV4GAC7_9GAST|nr:multiple epidermal growth factor-like domains protein 6 [Elysia marginata]